MDCAPEVNRRAHKNLSYPFANRSIVNRQLPHPHERSALRRVPGTVAQTGAWTWRKSTSIESILKTVPNQNGRVGLSGTPYPGSYSMMELLGRHPALKAVSPQAPATERFIGDDWRHKCVLFPAHAFGFCSGFGRARAGDFKVPGLRFDWGSVCFQQPGRTRLFSRLMGRPSPAGWTPLL